MSNKGTAVEESFEALVGEFVSQAAKQFASIPFAEQYKVVKPSLEQLRELEVSIEGAYAEAVTQAAKSGADKVGMTVEEFQQAITQPSGRSRKANQRKTSTEYRLPLGDGSYETVRWGGTGSIPRKLKEAFVSIEAGKSGGLTKNEVEALAPKDLKDQIIAAFRESA